MNKLLVTKLYQLETDLDYFYDTEGDYLIYHLICPMCEVVNILTENELNIFTCKECNNTFKEVTGDWIIDPQVIIVKDKQH